MAVLVTGGAGYIGSHTTRRLREQGHDVVVLDSLERGREEAVLDAPLVVGDIADSELVATTVRKYQVDAAVHFAAHKAVAESMELPARYFHNNVTGSQLLIEALHRCGVGQVVFSSTCAVYGTAEVIPVSERAPLHPESVYAETKRMIEDVLRWYSVCHGMRAVSLRYFNAAGAASDGVIGEDWTGTQNLVPVAMKAALGVRPPLEVFGGDYPTPDGTAIRDYIHVEDLADAHVKALEYLRRGGETVALNVGTGTGSSVRQVLDTIARFSGSPVPHEIVARRVGDPVALYSDNSLVRATIGWEPSKGLDEIIATAWRWHSALAAR